MLEFLQTKRGWINFRLTLNTSWRLSCSILLTYVYVLWVICIKVIIVGKIQYTPQGDHQGSCKLGCLEFWFFLCNKAQYFKNMHGGLGGREEKGKEGGGGKEQERKGGKEADCGRIWNNEGKKEGKRKGGRDKGTEGWRDGGGRRSKVGKGERERKWGREEQGRKEEKKRGQEKERKHERT